MKLRMTCLIYFFSFCFFLWVATGLSAELVVLTDGGKILGRVEEQEEQIEVTNDWGRFIVKKKDLKAVYQDAQSILDKSSEKVKEVSIIREKAQAMGDLIERKQELEKCIELLKEAKSIARDGLDVFSEEKTRLFSHQIAEINMALRDIRSLKVLEVKTERPVTTLPSSEVKPSSSGDKPEPAVTKIKSENEEISEQFYLLAQEYLEDKEYDRVVENLNKALKYNPGFFQASAQLGETYEILKDEEKAWHYYQLCLKIMKESNADLSVELILLRAAILLRAEKLTEDLTRINKDLVEKLTLLGIQGVDSQGYMLAIDIFNLVLEIEPENEEVEQYFLEAIELASQNEKIVKENDLPELADIYYELGVKSLGKDGIFKARSYFKKAIRYDKSHPLVLFRLAAIYEELHAPNEAIKYYYRCVRSFLNKEKLSREEKKTLSRVQGLLDQLDGLSRKFQKIKGEAVRQLIKLGKNYHGRGRDKFAFMTFQEVLTLDPENQTAFDYLERIPDADQGTEVNAESDKGNEINNVYNLNKNNPEWKSEEFYVADTVGLAYRVQRKLDKSKWYRDLLSEFSLEIAHAASDPSRKMLDVVIEEKKAGEKYRYDFFIRSSIRGGGLTMLEGGKKRCLVYLLKNSRLVKKNTFTVTKDTALKIIQQNKTLFFMSGDRKILRFTDSDLKDGYFRIGIATSNKTQYNLHTVQVKGRKK
ncbi:MAG: hypothetical protein KAI63_00610 [Planctomycetes bacterium]|nr:hypothetical protein [Planctomycetota bacterium]